MGFQHSQQVTRLTGGCTYQAFLSPALFRFFQNTPEVFGEENNYADIETGGAIQVP